MTDKQFKYFTEDGIGVDRVSNALDHFNGSTPELDNYHKRNVFQFLARVMLPEVIGGRVDEILDTGEKLIEVDALRKKLKKIVNPLRLTKYGPDETRALEGSDDTFHADVGTAGHNVGEMFLCKLGGIQYKGTDPHVDYIRRERPIEYVRGLASLEMWMDDFKGKDAKIIQVENPLVSKKLMIGGEPDHIIRYPGYGVTIGDFKFARTLKTRYMVQLGAYSILAKENGIHIDSTMMIHLYKTKKPGYEERIIRGAELAKCENMFMHCLALYHGKKDLSV